MDNLWSRTEINEEVIIMFCPICGAKVDRDHHMYCPNCGASLQKHGPAMDHLGSRIVETYEELGKGITDQVKGTWTHAMTSINSMVGERGTIQLDLRDVFSAVFKKHTKEEAEILFTAGTPLTTPPEQSISTAWPKPWLFSRILGSFALAYLFLLICTYVFQNPNSIPGLIVIGSFAVPFSLLIFFWETNAPMNISIYEVSRMFFIGGSASLVITLFLYTFFPVQGLSLIGVVFVGLIEELGKLSIIAYFVRRLNPTYILNGLLIGAAIGAGFASFESAGYAFTLGLQYGSSTMLSTIFERAWSSIGTHTVWAAISGAALVYVKGTGRLTRKHLFNSKFIQLFLVPIVLHALWDLPLQVFHTLRLVLIIVVGWVFIFTFINAGLKQIMRINQEARALEVDHTGETNF